MPPLHPVEFAQKHFPDQAVLLKEYIDAVIAQDVVRLRASMDRIKLEAPANLLIGIRKLCWRVIVCYGTEITRPVVCQSLAVPSRIRIPVDYTIVRQVKEVAKYASHATVDIADVEIEADGHIVLKRGVDYLSALGESTLIKKWYSPDEDIYSDPEAERIYDSKRYPDLNLGEKG
ncbi:MAG: hypothetical protein RIQ93_795 [Verrucomicrobiota bacterium]|jgi:hypothetical protein